jgi:fibronectin type 3 domain-containing protein
MHVFRVEDDATGEPKPALVKDQRVVGYAEVATIRMADPAPAVMTGGRMTFVDRATLTPGRRYTYVLVAEDARGHVSRPSERVTLTLIAPPAVPGPLRATSGEREVRLVWQAPAQLQDGAALTEPLTYEVLRGIAPEAPLAVVAKTAPGATSFVDREVENERSYAYAIRALRSAQGSIARGEPTERVTATPVDMTPPAPPTELVAIPSEGAVRLAWIGSPDTDVARYVVYRGREGGALERVGSAPAPGTTFTDRGVPAGRWRYAVSAQDTSSRANESPRSAEVTVTVP